MGGGQGQPCHGVMVVEDDDDAREMLQIALETGGYPVSTARHGREALERLQRGERPCVILLDLMMPVMSGIELLDALAADPELAAIPVVAVSAYRHLARTIKVAGFLPKPVDLRALLDVAERFCGADGS